MFYKDTKNLGNAALWERFRKSVLCLLGLWQSGNLSVALQTSHRRDSCTPDTSVWQWIWSQYRQKLTSRMNSDVIEFELSYLKNSVNCFVFFYMKKIFQATKTNLLKCTLHNLPGWSQYVHIFVLNCCILMENFVSDAVVGRSWALLVCLRS